MTSLDSPGFSITLLKATPDMLKYIKAPATSNGWTVSSAPKLSPKIPSSPEGLDHREDSVIERSGNSLMTCRYQFLESCKIVH
jgi:dihydroxyacetone kinase